MTRSGIVTVLVLALFPAPSHAQEAVGLEPPPEAPGEARAEAAPGPPAPPWEDAYAPAAPVDPPPPPTYGALGAQGSLSELSVALDASPPRGPGAAAPSGVRWPPGGDAPAEDSDPAGRVGGEILGGLAGLLSAGLVGVGLGAASASSCEYDDCELGAALLGGFVAFTGMTIAVPLGVTLAGDAGGGDGGLGWSILGGLAGTTVGVGVAAAMTSESEDLLLPALLLAFGSHFGGAILGYELSSGDGADEAPRSAREPSVAPTVALTRDAEGLVLGVAGTM